MTVRSVFVSDIPLLAEYWYDQMALHSQKQKNIRLMPDAQTKWEIHAHSLLHDEDILFLAVEIEDELLGCIIGRIVNNSVGLLPEQYGMIQQLTLDLHSPHKRKNAVNELLDATKIHFRQNGISHIMVRVPTYSPVEQGFWRGLGLIHLEDTFWMDFE